MFKKSSVDVLKYCILLTLKLNDKLHVKINLPLSGWVDSTYVGNIQGPSRGGSFIDGSWC